MRKDSLKKYVKMLSGVMLLSAIFLTGCAKSNEKTEITSASQLNSSAYTIGVPEGAAAVRAVENDCPEAALKYYSRDADAYLAVQQGRIAAFAYDRVMMEFAMGNGLESVKLLPENIGETMDIAVGISPKTNIPDLTDSVNRFLAQLRADGTLDDMYRRWVTEADNTMPDLPIPENPTLTLKVGTTGLVQPFSYYEGNQLTGYDIEMIYRFAYWMNADVEIKTYDYGGIIAAAESGSIDCIMANLNATDERREQIDFSDSIYESYTALMIRDGGSAAVDSHAPLETANYGVMTGSTAEIFIGKTYPDARISTYSSIADAFLALDSGKIDYVLTAYTTALNAVRNNSLLEIYQMDVIEEESSIAVSKDNPQLLADINRILDLFKENGTLDEVVANWTTQGQDYVIADTPASDGTNGVLRVAIAADREPMCFVLNGEYKGLDCELIERIAAELGMSVEYQNMAFGSLVAALASGKADVIISNMTATDERRESVDFTQAYFANPQVLVSRKGESDSVSDFAVAKYGIVSVTIQNWLEETYPKASAYMYPASADAFLALETGKVDYVIASRSITQYMGMIDSGIVIVQDNVRDEACSIAVAKSNPELRDALDEVLAEFAADGTLDEIVSRWTDTAPDDYAPVEVPEGAGSGGVLRVAVSPDVTPICFVLNGEYAGIDIELIERLAYALDMEVEYINMQFDALLPALESGKADIALSDIVDTPERRESVNFTSVYFDNPQVISVYQSSGAEFSRLAQMEGQTIGVLAGSAFDQKIDSLIDDVSYAYYNSVSDEITALKGGKVAAVALDEPMARLAVSKNTGITIMAEQVVEDHYGLVLPKGSELTEQINEILIQFRSDGTMDALAEKWFGADEGVKILPELEYPGEAGTLRFIHDNTSEPMSYVGGNGQDLGYDVELVMLVAQELDMKLEITTANFDALMPSIQSGKADVAAGCISITPEREKMVDLTVPYYDSSVVLVVRDGTNAGSIKEDEGFLNGLAASFQRTFITENRWKLILDGLKITVIISILSGLIGSLIGFGVCMLRRSKTKLVSLFAAAFIRIIQGTPIVVFLMILYYVIFASFRDISAVLVAVIGFSVNFGVYVSEMMRTGIAAVDKGQIEAATALGYNRLQAFRKVTFPQAARHFLPVFKGEFISMVKMTSVVGYIAVQDLTKVSDIIRSRTLEAFFPLIATAVIYFVIANILTMALSFIEIRLDTKRRKGILKGVEKR